MSQEPRAQEVNLAPPGAGLPWQQRVVLKFYFGPIKSRITPWEESQNLFQALTQKILAAIEGLTDEQLRKRVLIPPQAGLEDSSRNDSIAMVLEHLNIVVPQLCSVIFELSQGRHPKGQVDIAKLKALGQVPPASVISQFKSICFSDVPRMESTVKDRKSKTKFFHPWFGPINTHQWHWLLTAHHGIHYNQIKEIRRRVTSL